MNLQQIPLFEEFIAASKEEEEFDPLKYFAETNATFCPLTFDGDGLDDDEDEAQRSNWQQEEAEAFCQQYLIANLGFLAKRGNPAEKLSVLLWIADDDGGLFLSFEACCSMIGVNAEDMRNRIKNELRKKGFRYEHMADHDRLCELRILGDYNLTCLQKKRAALSALHAGDLVDLAAPAAMPSYDSISKSEDPAKNRRFDPEQVERFENECDVPALELDDGFSSFELY